MKCIAAPLFLLAVLLPSHAAGQPATLLQRAHDVLAEAIADTPHWRDARIAEKGLPLYRPDLKAIAYYEFPVVRGPLGERAGSIVLATGRHDYPIVQWGAQGMSIAERLAGMAGKLGRKPHRYYLLDTLSFAVEDSRGELIVQFGNVATLTSAGEWTKFKREYASTRAAYLRRLRDQADADWKYWEAPAAQKRNWCGPWEYHYAGTDGDQRLYGQLEPGESSNDSNCASGCGATAWAMLYGWIDHRAAEGDPAWQKDTWGVLVGDPATGAPRIPSVGNPGWEDVDKMIWEIRNDLGTTCVTGEQGLTWPWQMRNGSKYLRHRINSALWILTTKWTDFGIPTTGKRDDADAVIRNGRPVIIQLGWQHYPLAYGYRKKTCDSGRDLHEFKINEGNYGDLRWTSASTSFVGHVAPSGVSIGPGSYWEACRPPPVECDPGLVCYEGHCRRYPAEGEACFTWTDKPPCASMLPCRNGKCERPASAGHCTACVPGESNCNVSGCPSSMECSPGPSPTCIGGSNTTGNTQSPNIQDR